MKTIVTCFFSATIALAMSSCSQMQPTSTKSKSAANSGASTYGSNQTFPTQQGANPYGSSTTYGQGTDPSYGQYQQSAGQYSREADYVNVTPATPQYTNPTPHPTPQYTTPAPQYPHSAAAPSPQMGSNQEAAQPVPQPYFRLNSNRHNPAPGMVAQSHVVQPGETLYGISRMYDTTVDGIKGMNGLYTDLIRPGEVLSIP